MDQANRKKLFYAVLLLFLLPKIDLKFDFKNFSYKQFYYRYIFLPELVEKNRQHIQKEDTQIIY